MRLLVGDQVGLARERQRPERVPAGLAKERCARLAQPLRPEGVQRERLAEQGGEPLELAGGQTLRRSAFDGARQLVRD